MKRFIWISRASLLGLGAAIVAAYGLSDRPAAAAVEFEVSPLSTECANAEGSYQEKFDVSDGAVVFSVVGNFKMTSAGDLDVSVDGLPLGPSSNLPVTGITEGGRTVSFALSQDGMKLQDQIYSYGFKDKSLWKRLVNSRQSEVIKQYQPLNSPDCKSEATQCQDPVTAVSSYVDTILHPYWQGNNAPTNPAELQFMNCVKARLNYAQRMVWAYRASE